MDTVGLIQDAKYLTRTPLLNESSLATEVDDALTISFWAKQLNKSVLHHQNKIKKACEDYFVGYNTVSFSAGTNEYNIPGEHIEIRMIERVETNYNVTMHPVVFNSKNSYVNDGNFPNRLEYPQFYYVWGHKVGIIDADTSGTANVFYLRRLPDCMYGTVTVTGTAVTLPAAPTIGTTHIENDYYNGAILHVVSATTTGAGQFLRITDYVGSTRVATIETPTTAIVGTTIIAEIYCEIPAEHHASVSAYMAVLGQLSDKQAVEPDLKEMSSLLLDEYVSALVPRDTSESRHVHSPYRRE